MTGKNARQADEHHTTHWLLGYLHAAHLEALQAPMEGNGPRTVLDLDEVTLVEVTVHCQTVEVGHDLGQKVEIVAGLTGTELVIVDGGDGLREGLRVRPGG